MKSDGAVSYLFQQQRQEATCADAATARWLYTALAVATLGLVGWASARPSIARLRGSVLAAVALLSVAAAILDGPLLPLGLVTLAAVLRLQSERNIETHLPDTAA